RRAALRSRYRALAPDLASRGLVEEVPGRTAGEYRRQVGRALPEAATDFAGATELFEVAWYGRSRRWAGGAGRGPGSDRRAAPWTVGPVPGPRCGGRCRGSPWSSGWRWWWRSRGEGPRRAIRWTRRR